MGNLQAAVRELLAGPLGIERPAREVVEDFITTLPTWKQAQRQLQQEKIVELEQRCQRYSAVIQMRSGMRTRSRDY